MQYDFRDWVAFLARLPPDRVPPSIQVRARRIRLLALRAFDAWRQGASANLTFPGAGNFTLPATLEDRNKLAFWTYASVVGDGVGLWDGTLLASLYVGPGSHRDVTEEASCALNDYVLCGQSEDLQTLRRKIEWIDLWISDMRKE